MTERNPHRIHVKGKFLYTGDNKFYIKGVTYGTFAPDSNGFHFPESHVIDKDFSLMAENGVNCVRIYTVPPAHLFEIAQQYGLYVMVGLPWEQHITFLDEPQRVNSIISNIRNSVRACANHPSILCYTIGNEIPAPIVRWYGKNKIENFLKRLFHEVKKIDLDTLITYVNYPTTEYLDLSFLDFDCFNVYLETPEKLNAYISRLHSLAADRPLVLAEIGLDSMRNGLEQQSETLTWQIKTIFSKGCCGIFLFAWTDEWWRGGTEITDWDFGLVDRNRNPKPALKSVSNAWKHAPFAKNNTIPLISVVVCTYNGSATIKKCLDGILQLDYPNYEVIVVNDGSTDSIPEIVSQYPVKLITTSNQGLSNARNTGLYKSKGTIIAYIDDDAFPDKHWLQYLAYAYQTSDHACIGGPNIAPYDSEFISACVANAPGGPVHVMISDEIAEHVPGCNMTFRRSELLDIGGFDPTFRTAGDDVDMCWRLQQAGRTIGFHPSALVWHLRRNSLKAYWKQQKGYGKAEALLEAKWPEKYNSMGHITWSGRIYGGGFTMPLKIHKDKIFHGSWGSALFQSVYQPYAELIPSIPLMPEWYLISLSFGLLGMLGFLWKPMFLLIPVFVLAFLIILIQAVISARKNSSLPPEHKNDSKYTSLIILLHIIQPIARLYGRFANGLTPIRKTGADIQRKFLLALRTKIFNHWSEEWKSAEEWLTIIEKNLINQKTRVKRGFVFDAWDLQVSNGIFAKSRALLTIEEHGMGKQLLRFRCRPVYRSLGFVLPVIFSGIGFIAALSTQWFVAGVTFIMGASILINLFLSGARGMNNLYGAFINLAKVQESEKLLQRVGRESTFSPLRIEEPEFASVNLHDVKEN